MTKRLLIPVILAILFTAYTVRVSAQTPAVPGTPQPGVTGEVTGKIINRSPDGSIPSSLSVMLHILDQNYNQLGMLHTQSLPDGSFSFEDVPLDQLQLYAAIATYQGATYYSQPVPYDGTTPPDLELSIYDGSTDLSPLQVDEMHVLFNFAQDGIEISEIYLLSNLGQYTITGTLTLTDGQPASVEFPLPAGADYVFFRPADSDRFIKLDDSFVDKAPLVPGERISNFMVSYLLPYEDQLTYSYIAPLKISNIDFLLPAEQGVILDGPNLTGPEVTTLQDKSVYQVYSYKGLPEGQTLSFNLLGKPNIDTGSVVPVNPTKSTPANNNLAIEIGSGAIGMAMIAVGVWQWRKSRIEGSDEEDADDEIDSSGLDEVAAQIARLEKSRERGTIGEMEYYKQMTELRKQAKSLLDHASIDDKK